MSEVFARFIIIIIIIFFFLQMIDDSRWEIHVHRLSRDPRLARDRVTVGLIEEFSAGFESWSIDSLSFRDLYTEKVCSVVGRVGQKEEGSWRDESTPCRPF